jgi:hypothetical protein
MQNPIKYNLAVMESAKSCRVGALENQGLSYLILSTGFFLAQSKNKVKTKHNPIKFGLPTFSLPTKSAKLPGKENLHPGRPGLLS